MIIYNVTSKIESTVLSDWLEWMKQTHIPQVLATGKFTECRLCRVLTDEDERGGATYAVQYLCPNEVDLNVYLKENAPALRLEVSERFGEACLSFRTLLHLEEIF